MRIDERLGRVPEYIIYIEVKSNLRLNLRLRMTKGKGYGALPLLA